MNILLDSHILIWTLLQPSKLTSKQKEIILNPENSIFVSSISIWEISLKYSIGKLSLGKTTPEDILTASEESGFNLIDLEGNVASTFHNLPNIKHKDPFDRMLIWQCIQKKYHLMTNDKDFSAYKEFGLKIV